MFSNRMVPNFLLRLISRFVFVCVCVFVWTCVLCYFPTGLLIISWTLHRCFPHSVAYLFFKWLLRADVPMCLRNFFSVDVFATLKKKNEVEGRNTKENQLQKKKTSGFLTFLLWVHKTPSSVEFNNCLLRTYV